jgi:thioredoxin 1
MLVEINNENFEELVLQSKKNVILDFYADWCPPCKTFLPILEEISDDYGNEILFGKVNVDLAQEIVIKYHIRTIPHLIYLTNGVKIGNKPDNKLKKDCVEWIEKMKSS